jgi:hypothetical protein
MSAWSNVSASNALAERTHRLERAEIRKQREEREEQEKAARGWELYKLKIAEEHKYITIKEADSLTGGIEIWTSLAKHGILLRETFMIKYNSKLSNDEFVEKATELRCDHCHEIRNKSTELKCADCRVSRDKAAEKESELRREQERERVAELRRYYCREKEEKKRQEKERLEAEAKLSPEEREEREALEAKREEEKNKYITCDEARKLSGGVEIWKRLAKQKIWKSLAEQGILLREEFMIKYNSK